MKKFFNTTLIAFIAALFSFVTIFQSGKAEAQIVVPKGWESVDSVRFGLFGIFNIAYIQWLNLTLTDLLSQSNKLADSLGANFAEEFGGDAYNESLFGHRKGYMGYVTNIDTMADYMNLGSTLKQRVYYASTDWIPLWNNPGYLWRFNNTRFDTAGKFYNNTYDANDISPFSGENDYILLALTINKHLRLIKYV
jgi:hypothetical protein